MQASRVSNWCTVACLACLQLTFVSPPNSSAARKALASRLQQQLQVLRFRALEGSREHKEKLREAHDDKRSSTNSALHPDRLKIGDIVCVYTPSPTLKKLTYQWSGRHHIVVPVNPNTFVVRNLRSDSTGEGGKVISKVNRKKFDKLPSRVINRKIMSSYPVPPSFFRGATVLKQVVPDEMHGG